MDDHHLNHITKLKKKKEKKVPITFSCQPDIPLARAGMTNGWQSIYLTLLSTKRLNLEPCFLLFRTIP
jgi:hypothetical protein